ncbi:MAG: translation initiation factor IF-3 [Acidobacteriota bacterium]|nr:MAG: translation initiation factor IF-3 [Acidobacteriota bacterium]
MARVRVNHQIRAREIRVIDEDGNQLGIMSPDDARPMADEKGLDLVEIAPTAKPPVCRIMDYGKYRYEQSKKAHEAKKHQKTVQVKEVKFRPKIDVHDYEFKKKHAIRFLEAQNKVKATIMFRGREVTHPEIGEQILNRLRDDLVEYAVVERRPKREGYTMTMILSPKKE